MAGEGAMSKADALGSLLDSRAPAGFGGRWYGVMVGLVTDVADPQGLGRVKIRLPWVDAGYEVWARLCTFMGGNNRGSWFIPDVNDEVLVCFEHGDPSRPFVLGGLWNGADTPPETMDGAGQNNKKVLRSRNGVKVTLDDASGQEQMILETPGAQKITLKDGPGTIEIIDSNGNSIKLEPAGITVTAAAKVTVNASTVEVSAGMVTVNAGMSRFSGVVQCDTLISNSVVSASYTPGAGNVW
jgi:uncharacterized protein involved in type VI secretion and phage assembly